VKKWGKKFEAARLDREEETGLARRGNARPTENFSNGRESGAQQSRCQKEATRRKTDVQKRLQAASAPSRDVPVERTVSLEKKNEVFVQQLLGQRFETWCKERRDYGRDEPNDGFGAERSDPANKRRRRKLKGRGRCHAKSLANRNAAGTESVFRRNRDDGVVENMVSSVSGNQARQPRFEAPGEL